MVVQQMIKDDGLVQLFLFFSFKADAGCSSTAPFQQPGQLINN
jgi:hypothetical protein